MEPDRRDNTIRRDQDHDLLIRLDENVKTILEQTKSSNSEIARIEIRVRLLENFRYYILGSAAILGVVFGLLGSYLTRTFNK